MTGLERNGDVVRWLHTHHCWLKKLYAMENRYDFFDNTTLCLTPIFYVQKMFSTNQGDYYFDKVISKDNKDTTLAVSCVQDSQTAM
jgi:hypothetical protein